MATKSSSQPKAKLQTSFLKGIGSYRHFRSLAVIMLSLLLYTNAINSDYNLDDELVTRHHRLTSQGVCAIPEIFTSSYYQDNMGYAYEYRPVVLTTFALEHQIFGESPIISHFINVLLYAMSCLILLKTLDLIFAGYSSLFAFLITLIFIAHPAHTEVVCNIKNRDEILSLLLGLGALYYSLRAIDRQSYLYYGLIPLLFAGALMSKATVVAFVPIIPLCIILFRNASFGQAAVVSLFLLLPCYIILDIGSGFDKVKAILGLAFVIVFLFGLLRFKQVALWTGQILSRKSAKSRAPYQPIVLSSDLKGFFSDIIPAASVSRPIHIIVSLSLGAIYLFLLYHSLSLVALVPLFILMAIAAWGSKSLSWSAASVAMLVLCWDSRFLSVAPEILDFTAAYPRQIVAFILFFTVWVRRDLFMVAVAGTGIVLWFCPVGQWPEVLLAIPVLYLVRYSRARIAVIGLLALLSLSDLIGLRSVEPGPITVALLLLALHYRWHIYRLTLLSMMILATLFHFNLRAHDVNIKITSLQAVAQTSNAVISIANVMEPKIISKTQYRPILFIENCESSTDPLPVRLGTSAIILLKYLEKVIVPYPLSFYYGYSYIKPTDITAWQALLSVALYLILIVSALLLASRQPALSLGILIYLIAISIFSNFLIGIPGMLADRFLLIPSLGWCIALLALWAILFQIDLRRSAIRWGDIPGYARYTFLVILLLYSSATIARNMDWKDDLTLFRRDIRHVPESAQAHNLLAIHLMQRSTEEKDPTQKLSLEHEALGHFMASRTIYPHFFNVTYDIGRVYLYLNNADSALAYFHLAAQIDSTYPDLYKTMGDIYNYQKKFEEAIPYYSRLILLSPQDYYGYGQQSYEYFMLKRYDESIAINQKALNSVPDKVNPRLNIARAYLAKNSKDSAMIYLKEVLAQQPSNPDAQNMMNQATTP